MAITSTADWPSGPVLLTWVPSPSPYKEPVTSAHCFCFHDDAIVLVHVGGRGPGIPGGHVEAGESVVDCLKREVLEEAAVTIHTPVLLGAIQVDHQTRSAPDRYPASASILIYACRTRELHAFRPLHETSSRILLLPAEVPDQHEGWNAVLEAALNAATQAEL